MHWKIRCAGVAISTMSSIGFTASNPVQLVARQQAAPAAFKPPMGWSSDWAYGCAHLSDDAFMATARRLSDTGLQKAGYTKFIIECGWELSSSSGIPGYAKNVFPNGPRSFSDWLSSQHGLSMGLGTWAGPQLCRRQDYYTPEMSPHNNLRRYIFTLIEWNVSYLIHRPCDMATPDTLQNQERANALDVSPRKTRSFVCYCANRSSNLIKNYRSVTFKCKRQYDTTVPRTNFSMRCTGQWGASPLAQQKQANSWRISDENVPQWDSFISTINGLVPFAHQTRPGHYNDLGFLRMSEENGRALSITEKMTVFSFWAAAKSPLIFSDRVSRLDQQTLDLLKNPGAIAINQDDLGKSITFKRRYANDMDIWSGPLKDGSTVAVIINWADVPATKLIHLSDLGFASARLMDVWTGADLGKFQNTFTNNISGRGSLFLKLTETTAAPQKKFQRFTIDTAQVTAPAEVRLVNNVKVASKIGIEGQGAVVWNNIPGGHNRYVDLSIDYINAELPYGNKDHSKLNFRRAFIIVNGEQKIQAHFPISGMTWNDVYQGFLVAIPLCSTLIFCRMHILLQPKATNTIKIEGQGDWAPDIVAISVEIPAAYGQVKDGMALLFVIALEEWE
ncbi:hypothetical protein VP01_1017g3 [Puccinia sorghi]|uniref:alpha-galactosidase n=1 Tax=Puccinia sorghi TaxID=27349 RepID=A0A0L6VV00_9BASI|nr:hypothetical protein VP01_1017g3 [Puccinia sorghi]